MIFNLIINQQTKETMHSRVNFHFETIKLIEEVGRVGIKVFVQTKSCPVDSGYCPH